MKLYDDIARVLYDATRNVNTPPRLQECTELAETLCTGPLADVFADAVFGAKVKAYQATRGSVVIARSDWDAFYREACRAANKPDMPNSTAKLMDALLTMAEVPT